MTPRPHRSVSHHFGQPFVLAAVLLPWLAAVVSGANVAVIPAEGEAPPSPGALAQVEVALASLPDVKLLDREKVRALLKEQALNLSGAVEPARVIQAGKVLAADAFVGVERVPAEAGSKLRLLRVTVIETRTAAVADDRVFEESTLEQDPAPVTQGLKAGLRAMKTPDAQRHYVAVLGARSQEANASLSALAKSLQGFLQLDARSIPGVWTLDRARMLRLSEEKALTDLDQRLWASAVLIDATLGRGDGGKSTVAALSLHWLGRGERRTVEVKLSRADPAEMRRAVLKALAENLGVNKAFENAPGDAKAEAAMFAAMGLSYRNHENLRDAWPLLEASVALDPSLENRVRLQNALPPHPDASASPDFGIPLAQRSAELYRDLALEMAQMLRRGGRTKLHLNGFNPGPSARDPRWNDAVREIARMRLPAAEDLVEARLAIGHYLFAESVLQTLNLACVLKEPTDWTDYAKAKVELVEKALKEGKVHKYRLNEVLGVSEAPRRYWEAESREKAEAPYVAWLAAREHPLTRAAGVAVLLDPCRERFQAPAFANGRAIAPTPLTQAERERFLPVVRQALRLYAAELPSVPGADQYLMLGRAKERLCDPSMAFLRSDAAYWESVVQPVLEENVKLSTEASEIAFRELVSGWCPESLLARPEGDPLRVARVARVKPFLARVFPPHLVNAAADLRNKLNAPETTAAAPSLNERVPMDRRVNFGPHEDVDPAAPSPWGGFELRRVKLNLTPPKELLGPPPGAGSVPGGADVVMRAGVDDQGMLLIWGHIRFGQKSRPVVAQRIGPDGAVRVLGRIDVPTEYDVLEGLSFRAFLIALGDSAYLSAEARDRKSTVVLAFEGGAGRLITHEQGLPAGEMQSMAAIGGTLMLFVGGAGNPSLVALYSPGTRQFEVVASSQSTLGRNGLDGGMPYAVGVTQATPEGLKFFISDLNREASRRGWWWARVKSPGEGGRAAAVQFERTADRVEPRHKGGQALDEQVLLTEELQLYRYTSKPWQRLGPVPPPDGSQLRLTEVVSQRAPRSLEKGLRGKLIGQSGAGAVIFELPDKYWVLVKRDKLDTVKLPLEGTNALPK